MKKEVNDELLDKVSGGFSSKTTYSFSKGDTFKTNSNYSHNFFEGFSFIIINKDYVDVPSDKNISISAYVQEISVSPNYQTEFITAEEIVNNCTFIGNNANI